MHDFNSTRYHTDARSDAEWDAQNEQTMIDQMTEEYRAKMRKAQAR